MLNIMLFSNSPLVKSGYGVTTANLVQLFTKLGHKVSVFAFYGLEGSTLQWEGIDIYGRAHSTWGDDIVWSHCQRAGADVLISNVDTFVLSNFGRGAVPWVPLTPVMEDPLTPGIRNSLVGALDIIGISKYGQRTLEDGGVQASHIYLPVQCETYFPVSRVGARKALGWPEDAYIIGHVGMNRGFRKGQDVLLNAFREFITEVPNAVLYMHTDMRQHDGINLEALVNRLGLQNNVRFPSRYDAFMGKTTNWMQGFYNSLDLYVQPSMNEGQGMPLWEAYANGCVAVATDCTALSEALVGAESIAIQPCNRVWQPGESWAYEITSDQLVTAMLDAYRRWGKKYVSAQNRQWAIEQVSMPVIGLQWQDKLLELEKRIRFAPKVKPWTDKPKVVQVSTRVPNCGIGAYTRMLMAAMSEATEQDSVDIREWKSAKDVPSSDIVHIHYEPSIAPSQQVFETILRDLRNEGRLIVCTMHAVDPGLVRHLLATRLVNLVLIHWPPPGMEINDPRIIILGGMGVPNFQMPRGEMRDGLREQYGFGQFDKIITTFGFASVGRGHYEIVEELTPMLVANPNVKMQLLCPPNFLNEQGAEIVYGQLDQIASAYHIGKQIHVVKEFIPDTEVLMRMWLSDVGYLYIPFDTISSSSAVRFFTGARLPVLLTPSSHFADMRLGVARCDSVALPEFAIDLWGLLHDQARITRLRHEAQRAYESWRWPVFAEKMLIAYKKALAFSELEEPITQAPPLRDIA